MYIGNLVKNVSINLKYFGEPHIKAINYCYHPQAQCEETGAKIHLPEITLPTV